MQSNKYSMFSDILQIFDNVLQIIVLLNKFGGVKLYENSQIKFVLVTPTNLYTCLVIYSTF